MKAILSILCIVFVSLSSVAQTEISGITLPEKISYGEDEVVLNGAGVREKFWMDMYVSGLYLKAKSSNPQKIINADETMGIQLHIVSGMITSKRMIDAIENGFDKSTQGNKEPIREKIDKFIGVFNEKIQKGDVFDLTYQPKHGVIVYKNGKETGQIKGFEFKKALFGIWLTENPGDEDLKEAMLGQ
ncbi:chalcone isomerase family protein [Psychroflexus halocasei]|uniref:Chalcone isomerase-like n=1 Tax=Psychroflexus halocasei TaxID=908615 RepID=A0A1H3YUB8_9FLAO|nr:chalcone isomerase family protein [Psychroflexus halocasei]SEA14668.1 Chalcone isomerase-like [Psychroflexus halocasei]